jgi:hypothetical protein
MTEVRQTQVQLGDWVKGTTVDDERIRGYVEMVNKNLGSALVRVTESDREDAVGRVTESLLNRLELLTVDAGMDEQGLYSLIDIALTARDKQWFTELTSSLEVLRNSKGKINHSPLHSYTSITHRRIWMD